MTKNTLIKDERLTGKTSIDALFSSGESFFCYPFRIVYRVKDEQEVPCCILINVPKRLHKTAVSRNLLKRRIREAYRLSKNDFYLHLGDKKLVVAFLYTEKKISDYATIEKGVKMALSKLQKL